MPPRQAELLVVILPAELLVARVNVESWRNRNGRPGHHPFIPLHLILRVQAGLLHPVEDRVREGDPEYSDCRTADCSC